MSVQSSDFYPEPIPYQPLLDEPPKGTDVVDALGRVWYRGNSQDDYRWRVRNSGMTWGYSWSEVQDGLS